MADTKIDKNPNPKVGDISQATEADNPAVKQDEDDMAENNFSQYKKTGEDIAARICIPCAERIVGNILFSEKANVNLPERERVVPQKVSASQGDIASVDATARKKEAGYTLDEFESKKLSVCKKEYNELASKKKAAIELLKKATTSHEQKTARRSIMAARKGLLDLIKEMDRDAWDNRPYTLSPTFQQVFSAARNDLSELRILSKNR